ncbi:MAG: protein kinase [Acidobacteriia bacterium]|nr:protein kinase [Terriglobia bacterium]
MDREEAVPAMMEAAKKWVGLVARLNYPLRALLGTTADTAVFQTQLGLDSTKKAAIKIIPTDAPNARIQYSRWQLAAKLPHARLLRLFETGECSLDGAPVFYAVTEFADEDLSQILSFRPLNPPEARQVLDSILEALLFLHGRGIVHARLKPSNIMLVHGQIKLTFDGLASIGETRNTLGPLSPYDPPEAATGLASTAGDIWTLGMVLVESLTLELPAWQTIWRGDPLIPGSIPDPFLDIVRHCLRHNPHRRWTASEIVSRLRLTPALPINLRVPEHLPARAAARAPEPVPAPAPERAPEPPPPPRPPFRESLRNLWLRLPSFSKPSPTHPAASPEPSLHKPEFIPAPAPVASVSAPEPLHPAAAPPVPAPESMPVASVSVPEPILPPPPELETVPAAPAPSISAPEFIPTPSPAPSFATSEPAIPAAAPSVPMPEPIPAAPLKPEPISEALPVASVSIPEPILSAPPAPEPVAAAPAPSFSAPELIPPPSAAPPVITPKPIAPATIAPSVRKSAFRFPSFCLPSFRFPSFRFPKFHFPSLSLPSFRLPNFRFPKFRLPSFRFPKFTLPSFRLPDLHLRERFQKATRWLNSRAAILPSLRRKFANSRFLIPASILFLAFAAILIVPRLLTEQPHAQPAAASSHSPAGKTPPAAKSARKTPAASKTSPKPSITSPAPKKSAPLQQVAPLTAPSTVAQQPAPVFPAPSPAATSAPLAPSPTGPRGSVLQKVLPSISQSALDTVRGTVRISIKVHVCPSGNVLDAEFINPGPSKTFAALAFDAARQWTFSAPTSNGDALPSEWLLLFQITQSGVSVSPQQTAP